MKLYAISDTGSSAPIEPKRIESSQDKPYTLKKSIPPEVSPKPKDSTQFSADAMEINRYQELVRLHREAFSSAQETEQAQKLQDIRQKIASGFYDSEEGIDQLTERLIEGTLGDAGKADNLVTVMRRVQQGYYDREPVQEKTAENILKLVLPKQ